MTSTVVMMRRARSDRGSATLETVVLWPAVFLLIFGIVHAGIWFHARNIALTAAQEGARTGSVNNGTGGAARATEFVDETSGDNIIQVERIAESSDADSVTVTIVGSSTTLIPGWTVDVTQSSTAPIKRWTDP